MRKTIFSRLLSLFLVFIMVLSFDITALAGTNANKSDDTTSDVNDAGPGVIAFYPAFWVRCVSSAGFGEFSTWRDFLYCDGMFGTHEGITERCKDLTSWSIPEGAALIGAYGGWNEKLSIKSFYTEGDGEVGDRGFSGYCIGIPLLKGLFEDVTSVVDRVTSLSAVVMQNPDQTVKETLAIAFPHVLANTDLCIQVAAGYMGLYFIGQDDSVIDQIASANGWNSTNIHAICMLCLYHAQNMWRGMDRYGGVDRFVEEANQPGSEEYILFIMGTLAWVDNVTRDEPGLDVMFTYPALFGMSKSNRPVTDYRTPLNSRGDISPYFKGTWLPELNHAWHYDIDEKFDGIIKKHRDHMFCGSHIGSESGPRVYDVQWVGIDLTEGIEDCLEIEAKPDGNEVEIIGGQMYDTAGEVTIHTPSVSGMTTLASSIKLTVTIGGCIDSTEIVNVAAYDEVQVLSPAGFTKNGNVFTWDNLNPAVATAISNGTEKIKFTSKVQAAETKPSMFGYYQASAVWDLVTSTGTEHITLVDAGSKTKAGHASLYSTGYSGHGTVEHTVHDSVSWGFKPPEEKVYWEYHSHLSSNGTPNVYAQIKANECMAEDWEVLQGIPSTENLFIACGATLYTVDVGGSFESQKDITRTTEITVKTVAPGTNGSPNGGGDVPSGTFWTTTEPCTLSCTKFRFTHEVTHDCIDSYGDGGCPIHDPNTPCSKCGSVGSDGACSFEEAIEPNPLIPGDLGTEEVPCSTVQSAVPCGFSASAVFDCASNTWTTTESGSAGSGDVTFETTSGQLNSSGQYYTGASCTITCSHCGGSETLSITDDVLIDEGYTTGYGCHCSNTNNFEHAKEKELTWKLEEKISDIYYINISQYAIWGLSGFRNTETNDPIDENGGSVSNSFGLQVWDLTHKYGTGGTKHKTGEVYAGYKSGNGRLIFSSYPDLTTNLGAGWNGTTAILEDKSGLGISPANYFLGDCKVTIFVDCDDNGGAYTSDGKADIPVRKGGGKKDGQKGSPNTTDNTWESSGWLCGDLMTESAWENEAACVANMWMTRNGRGSNSGVTVVSDQMNLVPYDESANRQSQDIVNTMYQLILDNSKGENLFLFGSTADSDANGDCWCTTGNKGSVVRTIYYKSPMEYTVEQAWKTKGGINYRDVFGDDDIVKMGFWGSPGGTEGTSSYIPLTGPKDFIVNGAASSMASIDTVAGSRSGIELNNLVFTGALRDNLVGVHPYIHTELFYQNISEDHGSTGSDSFDGGYYQTYVYEGLAPGSATADKKGPAEVSGSLGMSATNSFEANTKAIGGNNSEGTIGGNGVYGTPFVMSNVGIKDFTSNGEYSEPVVVKAFYVNVGTRTDCEDEEIPKAPWAPDWSTAGSTAVGKRFTGSLPFQNGEGIKAGYGGMDTAINSIIIHDPITSKYDYIESVGLTDPGNDDRENMHEDTYNVNGRLDKPDYFIVGNDMYIWISDYDDFYDGGGTWGIGGPSNSKGTGSSGDLYSSVDKISYKDLSNYYSYSKGHSHGSTTGYKDYQYMTNWVYDRYVKFPFAVTYESVSGGGRDGLVSALKGNELAISDMVPLKFIGMENGVPQFTEIREGDSPTGSIMSFQAAVARDTSGPDAYLYPAEFAEAEGHNVRTHGWFFKFYVDTSAIESAGATVTFYTVAKNAANSLTKNIKQSSDLGDNAVIAGDTLRGSGDNNYDRNLGGFTADHVSSKSIQVQIVGRIGNLTIEDTGDFRFSELFKQIPNENDWLIDGVVHKTDENLPYRVAADTLNILNRPANASTNGHATTSFTYMDSSISGGKLIKTGKASPTFASLPLTPEQNNNLAFKSEAMRMGYYLYMDIDTWGNYYGLNYITKVSEKDKEVTLPDGTIVKGDLQEAYPLFDDTDVDIRSQVTKVDIRYMLLDLVSGEYIPIDIYYGEEGNRVPVFMWSHSVPTDDFKIYVEMGKEFARRNITEAERQLTEVVKKKGFIDLDYTHKIVGALDYTQDFIGYAEQIILDQKNRTFIGSSLINSAVKCNDIGEGKYKWITSLVPTPAYEWDGTFLDKNVEIFGQSRANGWQDSDSNLETNPSFNWTLSYNDDQLGLSEVEYGRQSQRWFFSIGLPSTSYVVPSEKAPDLYGDNDYVDYMEKYLPNHDKITAQIRLEKAHENLMKAHPHSVVIPLLKIKAQGEVFTLDYTDKEQTFTVYDEDAVTQPPTVIYENPNDPDPNKKIKKFRKPPKFEEWTIPTVFEPEVTSSDDLAVVGTH